MKLYLILFLNLLLLAPVSSAQEFKLLRFDEDYSSLIDSPVNTYNRIKFVPINRDGSSYLSFGGGVRQELDRAKNEDWGAMNTGTDLFSLQRYNLHADLHIGKRLRIFSQLRSGLEFGRRTGPRPIDEDKLNLQNLFVDLVPYRDGDRSLTIRTGRQEIQYGSGRLLDVRDGPNLRQYFDGIKIAYASSDWHIDGFVLANAGIKRGFFDNRVGHKVSLWGVYASWFSVDSRGFDLYYLGIERGQARFNEGVAGELRHTVGARTWRSGWGLLYNLEFGYQYGRFGSGRISAWGGSSEIGYRFKYRPGAPAVKLRADFISGDRSNGDGRLGTFNAMYPNGGYFGMNPQAGPANLWSLHPSLSRTILRKLTLAAELVFYWRQSLQDGIYRPDGSLNLSASGSSERYIGTAYIGTATWEIRGGLTLNLGLQYFETGKYINSVIPLHRDGVFMSSLLSYRF